MIGARRPATAGIARPVLHRILHAEAEQRETSVAIAGLEHVRRRREAYPLTDAGHRLMAEPA